MKDFKLTPSRYGSLGKVGVRNEWWHRWKNCPPDSVLLDVGLVRNGRMEFSSASLTPRMARRLASALVTAANEADVITVRRAVKAVKAVKT